MMKSVKSVRLDFQQEFIPHGYIELTIPRAKNGDVCFYTFIIFINIFGNTFGSLLWNNNVIKRRIKLM